MDRALADGTLELSSFGTELEGSYWSLSASTMLTKLLASSHGTYEEFKCLKRATVLRVPKLRSFSQ